MWLKKNIIYSLIFLVKGEICMALLPDFLGFVCFSAMEMPFSFLTKTLNPEVQSREVETTTTGVSTECASGLWKMCSLLERTSIIFHLESIQRVFSGRESCNCVIQLCRRGCRDVIQTKWGYSTCVESRMRKKWSLTGFFFVKGTKCLCIVLYQ